MFSRFSQSSSPVMNIRAGRLSLPSSVSSSLPSKDYTEAIRVRNSTFRENLSDYVASLYGDDKFSDIVLIVDDKTIKAHKIVLASKSPILETQFVSDKNIKSTGTVEIKDFGFETVQDMVQYMYREKDFKFTNTERTLNLYRASYKYDIKKLQMAARAFLVSHVEDSNALQMAVLAESCHDEELRSRVLNYIVNHHNAVSNVEDCKVAISKYPRLLKDIVTLKTGQAATTRERWDEVKLNDELFTY